MNPLKLFRVYDTVKKEYLFDSHEKEIAKTFRDDKEYVLPHFKGKKLPATSIIRSDKQYKWRFQIKRGMDHAKGET